MKFSVSCRFLRSKGYMTYLTPYDHSFIDISPPLNSVPLTASATFPQLFLSIELRDHDKEMIERERERELSILEAKEAISKIKSSFCIYELLELVNPLRMREIFKGAGTKRSPMKIVRNLLSILKDRCKLQHCS